MKFFNIFFCYFQKTDISSIVFKLRYSNFRKLCANWSSTSSYSDYSTEYDLLKYTDYVDRFKDFKNKYPYVTIEATCEAKSDLWDDPDCSTYSWTFETGDFAKSEYTRKDLVSKWQNGFGWDVGAYIGFGFKVKDDTLYLNPYINGWVYKAGMNWSCLEFGLGAYKITFHPENSSKMRIIHPIVLLIY